MFRKQILGLAVAVCCVVSLCVGAAALEVDCDSVYCFSAEDFAGEELAGVCITGLPDPSTGTVLLGTRVIRSGDILTAEQLAQMTFSPLRTETDQDAVVTYLPIYENRVEPSATMTISIKGRVNQAPIAEDSALETYKNLPLDGKLKVSDPEGSAVVYTITRQPKRGELTVSEDGSFTYTPKKNKVGVDSFTFTATDAEGKVSRQATVTIRILKPSDASQYTDTAGTSYRFAAEWMKNTGLFVGEQVGGQLCFNGEKTVSKAEFLTMMVKVLELPVDQSAAYTGYTDEVPKWLQPYLAAAMRAGLTAGLPVDEYGALGVFEPLTGAEAAVVLQNAMDLAVTTAAEDMDASLPAWAALAVTAMNENGIVLSAGENMTRGGVAQVLYQVSTMADTAPGLKMYQ